MTHLRIALMVGTFGALLVVPAAAQEYGPPPPDVSGYGIGGSETVIVTAPHFRAETSPLNGPLERVSLSGAVRFDDLNLATYEGARELRRRVREEARGVCANLANAYPVEKAPGTSCYKEAIDNGLVRADEAIQTARQEYRYRYYGSY